MFKRVVCVVALAFFVAGCGKPSPEAKKEESPKSDPIVDESTNAPSQDANKPDSTSPGKTADASKEASKDKPEESIEQRLANAERQVQSSPSTAIGLLEKILADEPQHRQALLLLTQATQNQAISLILNQNNPTDGYKMFQRSADVVRQLVQASENLTATEQRWLGIALYNEACAYAVQGNKEKALEALQNSVDAGYNDVAQTEGDEDLTSLRDLPEYQKILEQMKGN